MLKRIISFIIIFSMLWSDIAAAMDDQEESPPLPSLSIIVVKKRDSTISSPKSDTRERDPLLNGTQGVLYLTITPMTEIRSTHNSVNGGSKNSSSSSDEDEKWDRRDCFSSGLRDPVEGKDVKNKTCPCWPPSLPSCCKKQLEGEDVESSCVPSCWPFSCCTKSPLEESHRKRGQLLIVESDMSLTELKKQLLLRLVIPSEEDRSNSSDVIRLEEQIVDEHEVLLQKVRFLYSKSKDTSLEDFGNWFQAHVLENRYRWQDWGGIGIALVMAAGTGAAMSVIVEYSIYNSFFAHHLNDYRPFVNPLAWYINVSSSLTTLVDAGSYMPEATSPSTRTFTTPKSARENTADRILIPSAAISGIYLLLLHFQIQQILIKDEGSKGFWTNPHDQFWLATAVPLFSYLVGQTWRGMRTAVSNWFHPIVPEHVKEQVLALRTLDARLDHLPDDAVDDLYDLLKGSLFKNKPSERALYLCKGQMSDLSKVEGQLNYITLINYAEKIKALEDVEDIPATGGAKTRLASRVLAGLGLPAGFGLVAISVFGLLSAFMDPIAALTLSLTAAALGFVPESFLQGHNVKETLDAIGAKESGPKKSLSKTLKDPYAWGRGAAKVIGVVWSFLQNALTNLAPIFVSLVMLIPAQLGGSDTTQTVMTGVMIGLAIPYLFSELISGTGDMYGHAVTGMWAVVDFFYGVRDRIVKCCGKEFTITPARKKREIRRILKKTMATTIRFTPKHAEQLNTLKLRLNGVNHF